MHKPQGSSAQDPQESPILPGELGSPEVLAVGNAPQPPPRIQQPRCLPGATEVFRTGMSPGVQGRMLQHPSSSPLILSALSPPDSTATWLLPSAPLLVWGRRGENPPYPTSPQFYQDVLVCPVLVAEAWGPPLLPASCPTRSPAEPSGVKSSRSLLFGMLGCSAHTFGILGCSPGFGRSWSKVLELQLS